MEINIEQVEKLKERADVSYGDAKHALEQCNGDLLEAVIFLEKQGKVKVGSVGSFDSRSEEQRASEPAASNAGSGGDSGKQGAKTNKNRTRQGESFGDVMRKIWRFICRMIHKGNVNHFEVYREGNCVLSVPVNLLVLCLLIIFYVTLPALIIALFFGCSYKFRGPDLGKENINNVMDGVADAAENLKRTVQEAAGDSDNPHR
jgi:nucleoid DNA-binding protein